ncbi:MAG: hypothetical protein R2909_16625 [Gemmatimonadales bacterium]
MITELQRPEGRRLHLWLAALIAGCGAPAPDELPDSPVPGFSMVQAGRDCAPWDGPAVTLTFSGQASHPDSIRPPYLHLSLWKPLSELAGRTWRWPGDEQVGGASLCVEGEDCHGATAGVVRLDRVGSDSVLTGRLRLEFGARPEVAGSFRATWRSRVMLCG